MATGRSKRPKRSGWAGTVWGWRRAISTMTDGWTWQQAATTQTQFILCWGTTRKRWRAILPTAASAWAQAAATWPAGITIIGLSPVTPATGWNWQWKIQAIRRLQG